jgi:hypothetical protein
MTEQQTIETDGATAENAPAPIAGTQQVTTQAQPPSAPSDNLKAKFALLDNPPAQAAVAATRSEPPKPAAESKPLPPVQGTDSLSKLPADLVQAAREAGHADADIAEMKPWQLREIASRKADKAEIRKLTSRLGNAQNALKRMNAGESVDPTELEAEPVETQAPVGPPDLESLQISPDDSDEERTRKHNALVQHLAGTQSQGTVKETNALFDSLDSELYGGIVGTTASLHPGSPQEQTRKAVLSMAKTLQAELAKAGEPVSLSEATMRTLSARFPDKHKQAILKAADLEARAARRAQGGAAVPGATLPPVKAPLTPEQQETARSLAYKEKWKEITGGTGRLP